MLTLTTEQFQRFAKLIYEHSGIRLDDRKMTLLSRRLKPRLEATGIDNVDRYYQLVRCKNGKVELVKLLTAVTTNETSFYRTQPHFDWFQNDFLKEVWQQHARGQRPPRLRIWSAACSTGAEPYSLAICLEEKQFKSPPWDVFLLGTDLSEDALEAARTARYRSRVLESFPQEKLNRHFREVEGLIPEFELRNDFRERVTFERHNLMNPIRHAAFDCIFLRNVLIYFDTDSKQQVLRQIANALVPGGYLVIGPSEGIYGLENPLVKLKTFLYRKKEAAK